MTLRRSSSYLKYKSILKSRWEKDRSDGKLILQSGQFCCQQYTVWELKFIYVYVYENYFIPNYLFYTFEGRFKSPNSCVVLVLALYTSALVLTQALRRFCQMIRSSVLRLGYKNVFCPVLLICVMPFIFVLKWCVTNVADGCKKLYT